MKKIGLQIINISNPANPTEDGYYYDSNWDGDGQSVFVSGSYVYIANGISDEMLVILRVQ
jgi:hypothetical protein